MGNSSSKSKSSSRPGSLRHASSPAAAGSSTAAQSSPADRLTAHVYGARNGAPRGSRPDLSFLTLGRERDGDASASDRPRETKQEKEARRAEKERQARAKERERSMREESVDGGYLVTLGTYTGPEDFSKSVVRQLQLERRLAPFWKGLNDHSDSWTEAQLVAAVRGLPIPAADEVPAEMARSASQQSLHPTAPDVNVSSLMVPIASRSQSYQSDMSANLSASHPAFSNSVPASPSSPSTPPSSGAALFRGRAKTLASLATGMKSQSPDMTPQEVRLPKDSNVNGVPLEAYLYKEASECPICFLYYPPYLNKTRCCDQPICSECFVQIKRPDPHPPEHEQPGQPRPPEEEAEMLVSEVAACPYCAAPEFGVSYEPPPFRRGLAYANHPGSHPLSALRNPTSAMSSSSSLASGSGRRRTTSLSATAPQVVTTDRVRPDWAKKLADARANALRRSAAATALHNAAYVLGNAGDSQSRGALGFGRRRRTLFGDSPGGSGSGTPRIPEGLLLASYSNMLEQASRRNQEGAGETGRRRTRVDDLEDLMMMEAIRLSLAAEDDRKRKEDKDARKEEKRKAKEAKKGAKYAEKLAKKHGGSSTALYSAASNESTSTWASTSMVRSSSNLNLHPPIQEEQTTGKGKAPAQDFAGFNPLTEPASESFDHHDTSLRSQSLTTFDDPQRHLKASRAQIQPATSSPLSMPGANPHFRQLSNASSAASSFIDSAPASYRGDSSFPSYSGSGLDLSTPGSTSENTGLHSGTPPTGGAAGGESMFNFRSLAAMVGEEDAKGHGSEHIEHSAAFPSSHPIAESDVEELEAKRPNGIVPASFSHAAALGEGTRSRGNTGESSASVPPPIYVEHPTVATEGKNGEHVDSIQPAPRLIHDPDLKDLGHIDTDFLQRAHT